MTTDYDRISADDLSCQTEDRLDHTEGEQTTETVKGRAKRTKGAARKSPAKTSPAKKSVAKSGARKTAARKSSAQKTPVKKSVKKATAKTSSAKTASPRPKTATKADVRAQAKQRAEDQLVLRQRIEAIFEDGTAQTAKDRAAQKRAAKAEAKGLVWTLSALALAACGGGGGGSPAPVTGGSAGATGPQTATGGGNVRFESGARLTTTILSQTERDGGTVRVGDAAADAAGLNDDTIMDVDFRETGTFTVETARFPSDMMVAVEVGGIVDPTTGIQIRGGGTDASGRYEGPADWYSLPGSVLITPITNILARKYALEMSRGRPVDRDDYLQSVLDDMFDGSEITVTLDDILNPLNYILPNAAEFRAVTEAEGAGSILSESTRLSDGATLSDDHTLADVKLADVIARKSLELFIQDTDWYTDNNVDGMSEAEREVAIEAELARLVRLARAIEDGKPIAIPLANLSVDEAQTLNGEVFYLFA